MSSVWIQTIVVILLVAGAAFYVGRRFYRVFAGPKKKGGCAGGCGCSSDH